MDGGIDLLYSQQFGWGVQDRLQRVIRERHHGELLVGSAEVIETLDVDVPYLIAAPTMRVPMILRDSVNPFLATRAVLLLIQRGTMPVGPYADEPAADILNTVAFPGLGTGVGQVGPNTCARQVRAAIDEVLLDSEPFPATWREAQLRHQSFYSDRFRDLQRG
jgi:O-acetyl-ADP-ribose deacetylase (regulator of RNase III)